MMNLSRWKVGLVVLATVLGLIFTLPNLVGGRTLPSFLPQKVLNLGLDLQGGSSLLLEVDTGALMTERLTNMVEDVRTTLRNENIAFTDLGQAGGAISVRIADPNQLTAAQNALRKVLAAPLAGTRGGQEVTIATAPDQRIRIAFVAEAFDAEAAKAVEQSIEIVRRRIDQLGTKEPDIARQGTNRIFIQVPGESNPERLKGVIGQTAKLTFQMVDESVSPEEVAAGRLPPGDEVLPYANAADGPPILVKKRSVVTGEMLTSASAGFDSQTGKAEVNFRFNSIGTSRFADVTANNIGKRFAIVLDKKVISAPVIQGAIPGGSGRITGNFTPESANDLAVLLRAGALPTRLIVEEQRTVGAELGADAVKAGAISAIVGIGATAIFMVAIYGFLFGGISIVGLVVNGLMIVGIMSLTGATLTLPGIAGLILTLAVAVDANVLIYERMRDELRAGRSLISAMDAGFARAFGTIMDANITHLLSALILFQFGSGPVKGFAVTLVIGLIANLFTAVFVSRFIFDWELSGAKPVEALSI